MVVGVIYSSLDGNSDPKTELAMVKQSLMQAVPSVTPVQIGEWKSPEPVYANPNGGPFLVSIYTMEKTIQQLLDRTKALEEKFEVFEKESEGFEKESEGFEKKAAVFEKIAAVFEKKAAVFEKKSIDQERELTMLRPVKDTAIGIRDRFFATILQSRAQGHIILGNDSVIQIGNQKAYEGDVETDICLLEHDMIRYPTAFRQLYGLTWTEAKSLLGMVAIMRNIITP